MLGSNEAKTHCGNLIKKYYISIAMPQIMVAFALSYVSEILMLLHGDFGMSSDIVDSDQAVKR
jgi:hypothetical protein